MKNIVIIGMPGVGKTSVADAIGAITGQTVIDIDREIEKQHGPIPDIFREKGEKHFRAIEKQTVAQAAKTENTAIATGGGSVLDDDNIRALRASGTLYWIRRPLEELAQNGRPLSAGGMDALKTLWEKRKGLYAEAADSELKNETIKGTAEEIIKKHGQR